MFHGSDRVRRGVLLGTIVCSAAVMLPIPASAGASPSSAKRCSNYTGGAGGLSDKFTRIRASNVSCKRAHEVLGTWANSAGGTDLGFSCKARRTSVAHQYRVTCKEPDKLIRALDTQHG